MVKPQSRTRRGFWSRHFWPRGKEVLLHRNVAFAVLGASVMTLLITFFGSDLGTSKLTYSTVSTAMLAFAALSFGGCVTGATVAIALPNDRLLTTMAVNGTGHPRVRVEPGLAPVNAVGDNDEKVSAEDYPKDFRSYYADLEFTFIYSGVVQLVLALASVMILVLLGEQTIAAECTCDVWRKAANFSMAAVFIYSLLQLMATLSALLSIANSRDRYARAALGKQAP